MTPRLRGLCPPSLGREGRRLVRACWAGELTEPCVHGHLECSDRPGGPCFDEQTRGLTDDEIDAAVDAAGEEE